jgi:hypothetical protein
MKLKSGIIISEINGEFVAVPSGAASKSFNGMIRMNKTAAMIAKMLQNGADEAQVVAAMCEEYEGDEHIAREDFALITQQLDTLGLIEHDNT